MGNIVRMSQAAQQLATVNHALGEHMERMHLGGEIVKDAMNLISHLYAYGENTTLTTLGVTESLRDAGKPIKLTPAQLDAYESLRSDYLERMSALTRFACERAIQEAISAPREQDSSIQRILELLGE